MGLSRYRTKRDFTKTAEPRGRAGRKRAYGAFVVQLHDASRRHYDVRLEMDGVLKSWACPKGPSLDPKEKRLAVHVEDHPLDYASFEGVIPEGEYGGGPVIVWDRGTWRPEGDPHAGYEKGHLVFTLEGKKLRGAWQLVRMRTSDGEAKNWLLLKKSDEFARSGPAAEVVDRIPESVETGRRIEALGGASAAVRRREAGAPRPGSGRAPPPSPSASARAPRGRARAWSGSRAPSRDGAAKGRAKRPAIDPASLPGARRAAVRFPIRPQLATLVDEAPEGDDWIHEIKFDGYRILAHVTGGRARLASRRDKDWTARFPTVAEACAGLPVREAVVDGELVSVLADGTTSFQTLQDALTGRNAGSLRYYAFDLVHLDGYDLRAVPLVRRKEALAAVLADAGEGIVLYSDHVRGRGGEFHAAACRRGLEGIVSKTADGPYRSTRTLDWRKVKCGDRQEMVIGGYARHAADPRAIGSLLLGVHDEDGALRYAGKVGTGFSDAMRRDLRRRLDAIGRDDSPFADRVDAPRRLVRFADPRLVGEVKFTEWTQDGRLRHPSFLGLREDKRAEDVVREREVGTDRASRRTKAGTAPPRRGSRRTRPEAAGERHAADDETPRRARPARRDPPRFRPRPGAADGAGAPALTNPDRVLWPDVGVTKRMLADYWAAVAPVALPHVADRPLMFLRCPEGTTATCFFQKHVHGTTPRGVRTVPIEESDGVGRYLAVDDLEGLLALVQLGVLEVHLWGARSDLVEKPDRIVLDLDPAPDVAFPRVVRAALDLRARLESLGLRSWVKTTGGKGLHVVVPFARTHGWDEAKAFSRNVALAMARERPAEFLAKASKSARRGKIFVDWLRNGRGATAVAPYSPRARPGAPVATPISWDECDARLRPDRWDVKTVPRRVASLPKDPWGDLAATSQRLGPAIRRLAGA